MNEDDPHTALPTLAFGPFRLQRHPHLLRTATDSVRLGGRATELLVALVERAGEVVSRAELERQVWPHTVVEDSSLRVHVAVLRKALGDGVGDARYIANVPGRGYSFVAPVSVVTPEPAPHVAADARHAALRALPVRLNTLVGRDQAAAHLRANLPLRRLASIVGHGGMGKTALAVAVATELQSSYVDGACFVDLAPLADAALLPDALAAALRDLA